MLNPSIPLVATRHGKIVGVVQEETHIWRGIPMPRRQQGATLACAAACYATAGCAPGGLFLLRQLAGYYTVS